MTQRIKLNGNNHSSTIKCHLKDPALYTMTSIKMHYMKTPHSAFLLTHLDQLRGIIDEVETEIYTVFRNLLTMASLCCREALADSVAGPLCGDYGTPSISFAITTIILRTAIQRNDFSSLTTYQKVEDPVNTTQMGHLIQLNLTFPMELIRHYFQDIKCASKYREAILKNNSITQQKPPDVYLLTCQENVHYRFSLDSVAVICRDEYPNGKYNTSKKKK
ncbi:hypothetical protein ABEB36_007720 [Hypothenemus hampei]|uniref:Uncharacterized protein n=1 Tax=Hypothenemus hampei TaxID=57062 RepID=A0ABD1EUX9_HYPHA